MKKCCPTDNSSSSSSSSGSSSSSRNKEFSEESVTFNEESVVCNKKVKFHKKVQTVSPEGFINYTNLDCRQKIKKQFYPPDVGKFSKLKNQIRQELLHEKNLTLEEINQIMPITPSPSLTNPIEIKNLYNKDSTCTIS